MTNSNENQKRNFVKFFRYVSEIERINEYSQENNVEPISIAAVGGGLYVVFRYLD